MQSNKTQPTESQIQVLMSDWLGNLRMGAEGNYVHEGKGGIKHTSDESFQDYVMGNVSELSELELIREARISASKVVNIITDEPVKVEVGGNGSYQTYESGTPVINLATDYFDDRSLSSREKVDIMLGLASHEAAHVIYTEQKDFERHLTENTAPELLKLKKEIWNTIEDERIEFLLGDENPGLSQTLGATKDYYFNRLVNAMKTNGKMPTEPLPKLLAAMSMGIRYPAQMTREQVIENFDELDAIRRTLTPYPMTNEDCWEATDRVMKIIEDTVKKQIQKDKEEQQRQEEEQRQQQPQQSFEQSSSGGSPSQDQGQNQPQSQGQGEEQGNGQGQNGSSSNDSGNSQSGQDSKNPENGNKGQSQAGKKKAPTVTKKEVLKAIASALNSEQGQNVMKALASDSDKNTGNNKSREFTSGCTEDNEEAKRFVNEDDAECVSAGGGRPRIFIFKPKGTPNSYLQAKRRVNAYVPAMSKALACKSHETDFELRGLPSGKLNTNKLVALRTGNQTIFNKRGKVTCSSASVCILIDESGSMSTGAKLLAARDAAVLVNEAIARIKNVRYYCYGYTDDRLNVYSENGKTSKWSLGATEARGGTPTALAMKMCAERLRRFQNDPCLMLVLTDGYPDSVAAVIEQDKKLRSNGFVTIGVGIKSNAVQGSFKKSIVLEDMRTFAFDLGKITKGELNKMLVRTEEI